MGTCEGEKTYAEREVRFVCQFCQVADSMCLDALGDRTTKLEEGALKEIDQ